MWKILVLIISVIIIFISTSRFKINTFLALITVSFLYGVFSGISLNELVEYIKFGFGDVFYKTGLIYLFGIIIGVVIERTGAAYVISEYIMKRIGIKNIPLSIALSGFAVSIPVNCDSGFLILSPMCKAISLNLGIELIELNSILACGLFVTHTLVPPTAGPTTVASILGADMGNVIGIGLIIAILTVFSIIYILKRFHLVNIKREVEASFIKCDRKYQLGCFHAFLPIIYPLSMICLATIANLKNNPFGNGTIKDFLNTAGNPIMALFIAMFISFTLIPKMKIKTSLSEWIDKALQDAAVIILINSSAGAFAEVISNSGIMREIQVLQNVLSGNMGLFFPFFIAAIFKTVQGSSTVAMIATAEMMTSMFEKMPFDPVLCTLAIGAGSMLISHTNDSYFWVVAQMTGLDVKGMFKHYTIPTIFTGIMAFLFICLINILFFK